METTQEGLSLRWHYILGVDPGTTTGLSIVAFDLEARGRPSLAWHVQLPWTNACDAAAQKIAVLVKLSEVDRAGVVCEQFTITAKTAQRGQQEAEDALGMNGVIRRICEVTKVRQYQKQQASAAKTPMSDKLLRSLDIYAVGMKHANDATRHALLCGSKQGLIHSSYFAGALQ